MMNTRLASCDPAGPCRPLRRVDVIPDVDPVATHVELDISTALFSPCRPPPPFPGPPSPVPWAP
eukprot:365347-Chlamydomonas_euryale.AAC.2